ncbi:MAG TPA: hypothetical protein VGK73_28020 [Polyangiaceae bacterium]
MNPVGQFVSSEPVGPGAYRFGLKDGSSVMLNGAPAEELNRRITAGIQAPALGPGALAAGPSAPSPNASDAPTVQQNAFGQAAAAQSGQTVETTPGGGKVARMPLGNARALVDGDAGNDPQPAAPAKSAPAATPGALPQQSPQQPGTPQSGPVPLGYTMEAIGPNGQKVVGPAVRQPDGSIGVYVPPTAGSPGGFTKLGKQTLEQHQTARVDAADAERRAAEAQAAGVQAEAEGIAQQAAAAEEAKWQAAVRENDQSEEIKAVEARVGDLRNRHVKAREIAQSGPVDENQYMRGSRGVLSGIAMAMSAFGAVLGRSPNFAQEFIEGQIQRNIRRQELELQSKRKTEENALGELNRELGSMELAKATLAQMTRERIAADRESAGLNTKSEAMKQYNLAAAEGLRAKIIQEDAKNEMLFREHVMGNRAYYSQGRAGSSGGFLQPTLQGVQNVKDLQKPDAAGGAGAATSAGAVESLSGMAQAIVAADKIKSKLGADLSERDDPLAGPIDRAARVLSSDAERQAVELDQATTALAKGIQSAFGKSDRDAEDALQMASGGGSSAARARAADSLRQRAVQQARQQLAGLPPEQQRQQLAAMPPEARAAILGQQ